MSRRSPPWPRSAENCRSPDRRGCARAFYNARMSFETAPLGAPELPLLQKLKPEYQDVVMLRFVEDVSLRDTAQALKKTEGAVKLMQHRAIKELKNILGDTLSKI